MKKVKEVSATDQLIGLMEFLTVMGYNVDKITIEDVFKIKHGIVDVIENAELKDPVA
jgi:hypothetical protein